MYPNPTTGNFIISGSIESATVKVFNSLGQMIVEVKSDADQTIIDLSSYSNGIYYISIQSSSKNLTKKIIKQ